jgi:hypothetical protein
LVLVVVYQVTCFFICKLAGVQSLSLFFGGDCAVEFDAEAVRAIDDKEPVICEDLLMAEHKIRDRLPYRLWIHALL